MFRLHKTTCSLNQSIVRNQDADLKKKKRQKGPSSGYFSPFYIWSINAIEAEMTKTTAFLAHFAAVSIFHGLPVLMGLILVSAMITPSVGIHYRVHNSHPEPSHACLTPIFQIHCALTEDPVSISLQL